MNVLNGVLLHAVGASCASMCYTPQKKVMQWSWQTYWLAQAFVCWFLLPIVGSIITIPNLMTVLSEAPKDAMWKAFILGAAYGVGGTAFGLAIRYVGFSLTYAISIGISCVLGTLLPPAVRGELGTVLTQDGAGYIISGMSLGIIGIAFCGIAGRFKEQDLSKSGTLQNTNFVLSKGLPLCLLAGVLSALYGFSLDQGQPIADVANKYGAGYFQINVVYIFSNTGAFLFTAIYCLYLHKKEGTFKEYRLAVKDHPARQLTYNYLLAGLTGILWYSQFFFYGLGHTRLGDYKFTSWAIHMIMLVMFSSLAGVIMKEWISSKPRTVWMLIAALAALVSAVIILTYGNYVGN